MQDILEKAKKIQCVICDVDGVMTNGLLYIDNACNELKAFHVQDGLGLKLLLAADLDVAIITGSQNAVIDHRMQQLGITHYFKNQHDKTQAFLEIQTRLRLSDDAFAYIGDDLPDLPFIKRVGLGVAVANAIDDVKLCADYQTKASGGNGAVREVCDLILRAQGKYESAIERYFSS
ncbi:MAG: HAD hydrolase family protein [Gammaproteobacteria bacterium]|nr:HAD hydrolase family protein [Gammaproteobacteria bacterium]